MELMFSRWFQPDENHRPLALLIIKASLVHPALSVSSWILVIICSVDTQNRPLMDTCRISMSHKASPWEDAGCESWMKTPKHEKVCRQEHRDLGMTSYPYPASEHYPAGAAHEVYRKKLNTRPALRLDQASLSPSRS
jgi:hypothetical protein